MSLAVAVRLARALGVAWLLEVVYEHALDDLVPAIAEAAVAPEELELVPAIAPSAASALAVGAVLGLRRVTALLPRRPGSHADRIYAWSCTMCDKVGECSAYNLRRAAARPCSGCRAVAAP
jgi:hypothetical protein